MFSEVAEIALVAARLGQFQRLLKTQVILILNFTRPHGITYTNARRFYSSMGNRLAVKGSTTSNTMSPLSTLLFLVSFCFQLSFSSPPTSRITSYTVHYQTATNSYRSININSYCICMISNQLIAFRFYTRDTSTFVHTSFQ